MADFKTHITTSTVVGIGYGAAGYYYGMPVETCLVAGGLCSVSGMLPDLDSDSGVPLRETIAFSAAVIPMLMIDRFQHLGLSHEAMALAGGLIYVIVRFGIAEIFKRYTVHRGMWHSIPAAVTATLLGFLICACSAMELRIFKAGGVFLGFMTHLVLDEIWSFEVRRGKVRIKKSFGTALKFWSTRSLWANVSTYGKLAIVVVLAVGDPVIMDHFGYEDHEATHVAREWLNDFLGQDQGEFMGQGQGENIMR